MLSTIDNPKQDMRLEKLNQKIDEYNLFSSKAAPSKKDQTIMFNLLQEIDFMGDMLQKRQMDSNLNLNDPGPDVTNLWTMQGWNGISTELAKFRPPASKGLAAEMNLINLTKSVEGLPTANNWRSMSKTRSKFRTKDSPQALSILAQLDDLNSAKQELATSADKVNYFYHLQQFKAELLSKLAFELEKPADIDHFRTLLNQVNSEIHKTIGSVPQLQERYLTNLNYANSNLSEQLAQASPQTIRDLKNYLADPQAINPGPPTRVDLIDKIPALADFEIRRLGGVNNINWRLINAETGQQFVVSIEQAHPFQGLLNKLSISPINENFTNVFGKFPSTDEQVLTINELAAGGDLEGERRLLAEESDSVPPASDMIITISACKRIKEVSNFQQEMLSNRSAHVDVKLTNFLLNADGKFMVADKKGLVPTLEDGTISRGKMTLWTTEVFAPPEFSQSARTRMNPEKFNTFQDGLALYDYLVAPEVNEEDLWCTKNPLDFSNPYFKSEVGQRMAILITKMTDPDPLNRPGLAEVDLELTALQVMANNLGDEQRFLTQRLPNVVLNENPVNQQDETLIIENRQNSSPSSTNFKDFKENYQRMVANKVIQDFKTALSESSSPEELDQKAGEFKACNDYTKLIENGVSVRGIPVENVIEEIIDEVRNQLDFKNDLRPRSW